jgi:hypothetical protein
MSDEEPSPRTSEQKPITSMLIGIFIIAVGVLSIVHGAGVVSSSIQLLIGLALLAGGVSLVLAGAGKAWAGNPAVNLVLFIVGVFVLVSSGGYLSLDWFKTIYGVGFLVIGLGMIFAGDDLVRKGWKKYALTSFPGKRAGGQAPRLDE